MRVFGFIKSPLGGLAVLVGFAALGGFLIHRSNARERARAAQLTAVETAPPPSGRESIFRTGEPFKVPPPANPIRPTSAGSSGKVSTTANDANSDAPRSPPVLPLSLFADAPSATNAADLSSRYAPFGRLIPCETVITLESSKLDTPVIGLVTEDIWHDGRLVIPAGTEVHGRASVDRSRERIAATGRWVIVWRDGSPLNGTELVVTGTALDREKDDVSGEFGLRDGSAGLRGDLLKTDNFQEIKLFASTFLAGVASGFQELREQGGAFGSTAQVPVASGRNAALQGTADVLNAYARQIQETISRDGFFVRVPAGKQFYLYVTETLDQAKGTRGNLSHAELWRKSDES
jgi:hypothetical protein